MSGIYLNNNLSIDPPYQVFKFENLSFDIEWSPADTFEMDAFASNAMPMTFSFGCIEPKNVFRIKSIVSSTEYPDLFHNPTYTKTERLKKIKSIFSTIYLPNKIVVKEEPHILNLPLYCTTITSGYAITTKLCFASYNYFVKVGTNYELRARDIVSGSLVSYFSPAHLFNSDFSGKMFTNVNGNILTSIDVHSKTF